VQKGIEYKKALNTVDLCLKVFSGIGADVSASDIDYIAHRVPTRNQNGRQRQASQSSTNPPIICKFTRRIVRDDVPSNRRNSNRLLPKGLDQKGKYLRFYNCKQCPLSDVPHQMTFSQNKASLLTLTFLRHVEF